MNEIEKNQNNLLQETEMILFNEMKFYSENESINQQRMNKTDRMVKMSNAILGFENLKERQYMNRTARKESVRKYNKDKNNK